MNIPEELFEKEQESFFNLKQKISEELGFVGTDDEIEEALKRLLAMESEMFDNSMNDLVLKKYYESFLKDVYPQIRILTRKNNNNNSLDLSLLFEKNKINEANHKAIKSALATYFYQVKDGCLLNVLNSHEVLLSEELKRIIRTRDIFQKESHLNENIRAKHLDIKYNYRPSYWEIYFDVMRKDLHTVNKQLEDKIPDFASNLEIYEYHIKLYIEYITKYRFISAYTEFKEGKIQCQR